MRLPVLFATLALTTACAGGGGPRPGAPDPNATGTSAVGQTARAEVRDAEGRAVGTVTLTQTPHGVLLSGELANLPAGAHAMHVHDVGRCEAPFTSAGGHYNPTQRGHGVRNPAGFHAGDLPNFGAASGQGVRVDIFSRELSLGTGVGTVFDADGSSLVIHAGADDYRTDPAGNSGARIACGVIVREGAAR